MKRMRTIPAAVLILFGACALMTACGKTPAQQAQAASEPTAAAQTAGEADQTAAESTPADTPGPTETAAPVPSQPEETAEEAESDGAGVLNFTVVLHLEGWDDGEKEASFRRHAELLRGYADLFEQYGAKMTLESKEIIEGCLNWDDNVLLEMQQRGHAVGIHADAGGSDDATVRSIAETLTEMKANLALLGIDASFASGVASKADWVTACERAGIDTVSCMVCYGLWSLKPALRPAEFRPYKNPADGHGAYPFDLADRVSPWRAKDGASWILDDPTGALVILPTGLSLNNAVEELSGESGAGRTEFTQDDIEAWAEALPQAIAATDSGSVNTFYAVWSFGNAVDTDLLAEWLELVDGYVRQGSVRWSTVPEMAALYRASLTD